jgi:hypothetical protein
MPCRAYPDAASARAACRPGEVAAARIREYADGHYEVIEWGVVPAEVVIDQGEGREPVRQPFGELSENWWSVVESEATRERDVRPVLQAGAADQADRCAPDAPDVGWS